MGVPVEAFEELDSTNAEARRRAEAGATGPVWITARRQTAGRGRRGSAWQTGQGNLAATLLWTTDRKPADAANVSFLAAVAITNVVDDYVPWELTKIKWPNDVLIGGDKVSGILIESGKRPDGRLWLAIGIGLNIDWSPADTERAATHVNARLRPDAERLTVDVGLEKLSGWLVDFLEVWEKDLEGSFLGTDIFTWWYARGYGLGERCTARLGTETLEGVYEGIDEHGAMILALDNGTERRIAAADVFFGDA
jgi:BirA family biotin operon repressor/biotin-[acetyl-CoA-carboxylase] ligase